MIHDDLLEELIEIQRAGHPCRFEPASKLLTFTSELTGADDVLRFKKHFPALDSLTVRCEAQP